MVSTSACRGTKKGPVVRGGVLCIYPYEYTTNQKIHKATLKYPTPHTPKQPHPTTHPAAKSRGGRPPPPPAAPAPAAAPPPPPRPRRTSTPSPPCPPPSGGSRGTPCHVCGCVCIVAYRSNLVNSDSVFRGPQAKKERQAGKKGPHPPKKTNTSHTTTTPQKNAPEARGGEHGAHAPPARLPHDGAQHVVHRVAHCGDRGAELGLVGGV